MNNVLIWSGKRRVFWCADEAGYTDDIEHAGRYTPAEAGNILARTNNYPPEHNDIVPEELAEAWQNFYGRA